MRQVIALVFLVLTLAMRGTAAHAAPCCQGDCDGDGAVTVNEIITLVDIDLGTDQPAACQNLCPCGIPDLCAITLVIRAINYALTACPQ